MEERPLNRDRMEFIFLFHTSFVAALKTVFKMTTSLAVSFCCFATVGMLEVYKLPFLDILKIIDCCCLACVLYILHFQVDGDIHGSFLL